MAECVPPDVAQAELSPSRTNIVLLDRTRVVTAAGDWAGEHPSFLRFRAPLFPAQQDRGEIGIEWKIVLRIPGLNLVDNSIDHAAGDPHREFAKVDVRPLQRKNFADLRPRHCATTTMVRYGSGNNPSTAKYWSTVRMIGFFRRVLDP